MKIDLSDEGDELIFSFVFQDGDVREPSTNFSIGDSAVRVALNGADASSIHPDLIALSSILMCHPFVGKELYFPLPVSSRFEEAIGRVVSRYKFISEVNTPVEHRKVRDSFRPGLAFSGGVDSTAALSVLPADTAPIFMQRPLRGKTLYNPDAALNSCKALRELGFDVRVIQCDVEYLRKPVGFPTDLSHAIPAILLSDELFLDSIAFGTVLESAFGIGHEVFREYGKGSHWRFYGGLFEAAGVQMSLPVAGISEVGTAIITNSDPLGELSQSCIRGTWGEPCGNCWKCCRKGLLGMALGINYIDVEQGREMFSSNEVMKKMSSVPISHENVIEYSIQRVGDHIHPIMPLLRERVDRGSDLEILENWYSPSIEFVPEKYRRKVREKILRYLRPMTEEQEEFLKEWTMEEFLKTNETRSRAERILKISDSTGVNFE